MDTPLDTPILDRAHVTLRMALAQNLEVLRSYRQLSISHLADFAGVSSSELRKIIHLKHSPTLEKLDHVAVALHALPCWLLLPHRPRRARCADVRNVDSGSALRRTIRVWRLERPANTMRVLASSSGISLTALYALYGRKSSPRVDRLADLAQVIAGQPWQLIQSAQA